MITRKYKLDNIRCILIFCVVFGHLIETINGTKVQAVYQIIYSFHMPVFLFITGYLATFKPKKVLMLYVYTYFLFQFLYTIYAWILYDYDISQNLINLQFTTPQWPLWYMFVCIVYLCLIPLIDSHQTKTKIIIISFTCAGTLLSGFDSTIGYYLSLARMINFLPFFVVGYYVGHGFTLKLETKFFQNPKIRIGLSLALGILLAIISLFLASSTYITNIVLYRSYPYDHKIYGPLIRAVVTVVAFLWILFFFLVIPEKKIPVLSKIGGNTYPIYVLHGFLVLFIRRYSLLSHSTRVDSMLAVGITIAIMLLLGNDAGAAIFHNFFTGTWLSKISSLRKHSPCKF